MAGPAAVAAAQPRGDEAPGVEGVSAWRDRSRVARRAAAWCVDDGTGGAPVPTSNGGKADASEGEGGKPPAKSPKVGSRGVGTRAGGTPRAETGVPRPRPRPERNGEGSPMEGSEGLDDEGEDLVDRC